MIVHFVLQRTMRTQTTLPGLRFSQSGSKRPAPVMVRHLALLLLCACSAPMAPECRTGADCASGVCSRDGTCMGATDGGAGGGAAGSSGGGAGGAAAGGAGGGSGGATGGGSAMGGGSGGAGGGTGPSCLPNNDGTITRAEVPLGPGFHATFKVASDVTFNSTPVMDGGVPTWDFTRVLAGDHNVLAETMPIAGKWFENDFAGASYVTKLAEDSDLLGIFEVKSDGLYLRGVASPMDSFTATKMSYSPPAKLLAFPLSASATWTTTSTVAGTLNGGAWVQYETYDSTADSRGVAKTPFASFDVIRVKTVLRRTVGFVVNTTRSQLFVTECFGTIATLTSQLNESSSEFSDQAEVRRLSP